MYITDAVLLAVLIPANVVIYSIVIAGVITFRKSTYDFEKLINNQLNKNR